jgi:hypothetical protein
MTQHDTTPQDSKPRPIGTMSIDVKTIYERLRKTTVGETVKYSDLETLIGRPVRERNGWLLLSARRRLLYQDGILFGVVQKIGVKRLTDSEIVAAGRDDLSRIHRAALRGGRKLTSVQDYNGLSQPDKLLHGVTGSALAVLSHLTKEKQLKRIEAEIEKDPRTLPLQKTLAAFKE